MSTTNLLPSIFQRVHAKFRTPAISIIAFCGVAVIELIFAALPSLDELRGKIVGLLQAPATKLAGVIQAPAGQLARVIGAYSMKEAA